MTKARLHPSLLEFKGAMGDMVFKKRGKKVYVSIKPEGTSDPSEKQVAQRRYFKKAVNYATSVMADETSRAFYEDLAQRRETTARALCMGDFLNSPTIDDLNLSQYKGSIGDQILITTNDDIGVVRVNVQLTETDGRVIEKGQAVELGAGSGNWAYTATTHISTGSYILIEAEAYDRPGHRTVVSANPAVGMTN
jgi:hypothetical protein